ncbi:PC-Esterase [Artemisia annua]|uniref:PC-Esterase n=1 Tax=Artemisia annua TaxID=35608 RepID=A0A2U1NAS1_ARTAN|nr:PC-Esterase [Artemisia annua]
MGRESYVRKQPLNLLHNWRTSDHMHLLCQHPRTQYTCYTHSMIYCVVHRTTNAYNLLDGYDLFSGKWVFDNESYPLYKELDCPYVSGEFACVQYGRMDSMYRQWRWQPQACNLPRFDARIILERLSGKRILFVGDSLNRNQFVSMVCMLRQRVCRKFPMSH